MTGRRTRWTAGAGALALVLVVARVGAAGHGAPAPLIVRAPGGHAESMCRRARVRHREPVEVGRIRITMPRALDAVDVLAPLDDPPVLPDACDAAPAPGWRLFASTRMHVLDVTFPTGVSLALGAHQPLLMHATATGAGRRGAARVMLYPTDPDQIGAHAGALFADDRGVSIDPGSGTAGGQCLLTGTADSGRELTIVALAGHYHGHGRRFTVERIAADGSAETVYEHRGTSPPPLVRYPDDEPLVLEPGDVLAWTCSYENDGDATLVAGPGPADEHCTLTGFYYPTDITPESIVCLHADPAGSCPDGDICRGGPCADGISSCDVVDCPEGDACDDGDACTENDTCSEGLCAGSPLDCDDGNPCTVDACDPDLGCTNVPDNSACDDGNACTVDTCDPSVGCTNVPDDSACDDANACTVDTCDPSVGCANVPDDSSCDDGDPCTTDACDPDAGCTNIPCRTHATAVVDAAVGVDESAPDASLALLSADTRPAKRAFFRVVVSDVGGVPIASAKLRLHVADVDHAASVSGGRLHVVPDCGWDASTLTWATQPAFDPATVAEAGAVANGDTADFDVTGAIAGDGTYCFALDSASTDGVDYAGAAAGDAAPTASVTLASDCACP